MNEQIGAFDWASTVANLRLVPPVRRWVNTLACASTSPITKTIFLTGPASSIKDADVHMRALTKALANYLGLKRVDVYLTLEKSKDRASVLEIMERVKNG